jgi:hypothetical protein
MIEQVLASVVEAIRPERHQDIRRFCITVTLTTKEIVQRADLLPSVIGWGFGEPDASESAESLAQTATVKGSNSFIQ